MDELAQLRESLFSDDDNIPTVLTELTRLTSSYTSLNADVLNLRRRYNNLLKDIRNNDITREQRNIEMQGVVNSISSVINELGTKLKAPVASSVAPSSSPITSSSTPSNKLSPTEVKTIVGLLTPIMGTSSARYALMVSAFGPGSPLLSRVDLEGNANVVTTLLVNSLIEYGKVNDDGTLRPALWVLLQKAKDHYGSDKGQEIDNLRPYFE